MAVSAAPRDERVSDSDLIRLVEDEVRAGVSFENDAKADSRARALDYYDGRMPDLPSETGRSSVVSRDVSDVIDAILPGLMRVFAGAGTLGVYQPAKPEDEEAAKQATEYVNFVLSNDCNGYLLLLTAILDGLQVRNGVLKVFWDPAPEYEVEEQHNLTPDQVTMLFQSGDVRPEDILGVSAGQQMIPGQGGQPAMPLEVYDIRFRRVVTSGRLRIENVPPEDFGISGRAKAINGAPCVWHRPIVTRSDLIKQGYPRDVIEDLPAYSRTPRQDTERDRDTTERDVQRGRAMDEIEIIEAYLYADRDGDGIAESRKVVLAGGAGKRRLLEDEEWPEDDRPFVDLNPQPVPHRWMGRSLADSVMDLQRVKTVLWRGTLDNVYARNMPDREVVEKEIIDPDEVMNKGFGNRIRVKSPNMIRDIVVPDTASTSLAAVQAVDSLIARRTGISQATAALDETALDPQTATAEQIEHDAGYARTELVARNLAEGIKTLFSKMLRVMVRNQDRPRTIRLRNKWVEFDPRAWNAGMDVSVNVGLGTGSRERDLKMLGAVYARQVEIVRELGQDNPIVRPAMVVGTLHKMVEASGLRDPDSYFADLSDADFAQWKASQPPPPPDPRVQAATAQAQARIQADQQRAQAQIALGRERQQADVQADQAKQASELEMARAKLEQEYALKVEELNREYELRQQEMAQEVQLRAAAMVTGAHGVSTNIPRQ